MSDVCALTIAGSDSGGGAGIQADLKTFEAHGVFGLSVLTAVTAQNSVGVQGVEAISPDFVRKQLNSVMGDFAPRAAKTGMLFDIAQIEAVAEGLAPHSLALTVDPVMVATSGDRLLRPEAEEALKQRILPLATVITPNALEAEALTGQKVDSREAALAAAEAMAAAWPQAWILLKGAHARQDGEAKVYDLLLRRGESPLWLEDDWIDTPHTHGTGCTLSAAITANIAKGMDVREAVQAAKSYISAAIRQAWQGLGKGHGSLRHAIRPKGA